MMFKIAILISLFAVAQVSVEKKTPMEVNTLETIKKNAPEIALLCSVKKATTCFRE
ncbi:MAG: hypothetical protein KBT58_08940 [Bizionia sp.]|nr:hypothetical protein [Bizionia sp.]